ncbi:Hypothetical predicted protein [Olea europaea subsp. europaea]|uniref:Uncharacterized protein n=1 Tax=Olea europaea subsp. europaea TaxID=158383 RepID=A0A8S0T1W7_OLEEU|nr:Hypothetical predicted protein [Olea europaea subsp. europaea]
MPHPGSDEKEEVANDRAMIGPPRPLGEDGKDDEPIIGPPRPPLGPTGSDSDVDIDGEPKDDRYRILPRK